MYPPKSTCAHVYGTARALLTLFRVISMDSWSMIMYYNIWGCGQPEGGPDGNGEPRGYGATQPASADSPFADADLLNGSRLPACPPAACFAHSGDYKGETGMECEHTPSGFFAAMYFVLFMCTVAFLILNLFIGTYARPTPLALPSASLLSPLRLSFLHDSARAASLLLDGSLQRH